jgi:hypothetical protein
MKAPVSLSLLATLLTGVVAVAAPPENVKEVAVFKSNGPPVNWLAFSPDGTRLAAAMSNGTTAPR